MAVGSICYPLWAASRWLSALSAIHCGQLPAGCRLYLPSTVGSFPLAVSSICHPLWTASGAACRWCVYANATLEVWPTLCFPCCARKSVLHVCVSLPLLQTGSSVSFSRFCVYVLIYEVCFSLSDRLVFMNEQRFTERISHFRIQPLLCRWTSGCLQSEVIA